jgi:hypothetical protein
VATLAHGKFPRIAANRSALPGVGAFGERSEALKQFSLRQAYFRLGVSTEPKLRGTTFRLPSLPPHIRNAQRVLLSVRTRLRLRQMTADERKHLCDDLRPLHEQLCVLFTTDDRGASRAAFRKSA